MIEAIETVVGGEMTAKIVGGKRALSIQPRRFTWPAYRTNPSLHGTRRAKAVPAETITYFDVADGAGRVIFSHCEYPKALDRALRAAKRL